MLHDAFDGSVAAVEMSKFVFLALLSGCMCRFSYLQKKKRKIVSSKSPLNYKFKKPSGSINLRIDCVMMFSLAQRQRPFYFGHTDTDEQSKNEQNEH